MKRTILALALSSIALGAAPAFADPVFDGLYAGVEGGYSFGKAEATIDPVDPSLPNIGADADMEGGVGSAFGGYGKTFGNVYVGGEGNVSYSGSELEIGGETAGKTVSYGAAGRLGYLVTPDTMAYGKVGYERAHFEADGSGEELKLNGLVLGVGAEHNLGDGLGLRAGVDYTKYQDRSVGSLSIDDEKVLDAEIGGEEVSAKAGIVFRF